MTRPSRQECTRRSPSSPSDALAANTGPVDCSAYLKAIEDCGKPHLKCVWKGELGRKARRARKGRKKPVPKRHSKRAVATRWPDNPTRAGVMKFAHLDRCRELVANNDFRGTELLCEGHFGGLQFLHAQPSHRRGLDGRADPRCASGAPDCPSNDSNADADSDTLLSVRDWAKFNFDVATGTVETTQSLCDAVEGYPALAAGLGPVCGAIVTVGDLYRRRCRGRFGQEQCTSSTKEVAFLGGGRVDVKRLALGAVLHAIQDSYSMSHANRSSAGRPSEFRSLVQCGPILEHYRFKDGHLQETEHTDADRWPDFDWARCGSWIDPITASARVIRLVDDIGSGAASDTQREAFGALVEVVFASPSR